MPKTLVFAKDDSHAEDIVRILREEFGKGNDFAQKITYRTTGAKPEDLIASFRNSYFPRVVVTVDMIATGTDIKPLECVLFMRAVKSRTFFEQMKGRGVRIISPHDLQAVTPDAKTKDHFVIVDAVGVCERDKTDSRPMDQSTQGAPLTFEALKNLADTLQAPPRLWTESQLWQAYAALDKSKVKGENRRRILTDLVSLARFAMHQDNELVPFPERVSVNFKAWLAGAASGRDKPFTEEQIKWLTMIRDHIAANLGIEADDFELSPSAQEGGIGRVYQLFGPELSRVLVAINEALVA